MLVEAGVVWFARRDDGWESDSERVLRAEGIPVERLEPAAAARLFPSLATDDLAFALLEPAAGVLRAGRRRARAGGAGARGRAASSSAARRARRASWCGSRDRALEADHVVWACGGWLGGLFPELVRLRVTRQQVVLFDAGAGVGVAARARAGSTSTPASTVTR